MKVLDDSLPTSEYQFALYDGFAALGTIHSLAHSLDGYITENGVQDGVIRALRDFLFLDT